MTSFTVTADDIEKGTRKSPRLCPVALCIERTICAKANVRRNVVYFETDTAVILPEAARDFIERFDDGLPVSTFTFELPK